MKLIQILKEILNETFTVGDKVVCKPGVSDNDRHYIKTVIKINDNGTVIVQDQSGGKHEYKSTDLVKK
jgi:16S rRNA U1498 N3-methylase RsmE